VSFISISFIRFAKNDPVKHVLLLLFFIGFLANANSQCQPDPAITNIYQPVGNLPLPPDGLLKPSNFFAYPGQTFSQVITALAPQSTTVANPLGFPPTITVTINWIRVTSINNLPAWVSYQCGGQLDPLDPCKMAYPTWSCVSAYANTANGKVPMNEVPGTIYSLDVIVDANVSVLGTQSNYSGGSISLFILDSMTNSLTFNPCEGGTITANPFGGFNDPGAFVYTWSNGASSESISNVQSGWYSCTVLDQVTGWTATDSIYVNSTITPITISDINVTQPAGGNNGAIISSATGGTGNLTYAWIGPNGFTAQGTSIANLAGGTYILTVTDTAGCSNTATRTIEVTALAGISTQVKVFKVTPNPSSGILNVMLATENPTALQLKVVDQLGKVVFELENNEPTNQHREQLDLTHLAKGVYFIQAISGDKTSSIKFVIK
jgi:hypothetical protein